MSYRQQALAIAATIFFAALACALFGALSTFAR